MALISNGSIMLLKYKLNNVCDADNRPTMVHKQLNDSYIPQYIVFVNIKVLIYCTFPVVEKANTHYLRIKCVLQAHHENNAYCVRIG